MSSDSLRLRLLVMGALLLPCGQLAAQTITSVTASLIYPHSIQVGYSIDLPTSDALEVGLAYSSDGGATFSDPPPAATLSGDLGTTVVRGTGKGIRWSNAIRQLGFETTQSVVFRLWAQPAPGPRTVEFLDWNSSATEGMASVTIPFTVKPYWRGDIPYTVVGMSTATTSGTEADVQPLSGVAHVDGTAGNIQVAINDNLVRQDVRALILELGRTQGGPSPIHTGPAYRHTLLIYDNDAVWHCVLQFKETQLGFRMQILRQGSLVQASILPVAGTTFPDAPPGGGVWPMTCTFTPQQFLAVSGAIPAASTSFFPQVPLTRTLRLTGNFDYLTTSARSWDKIVLGDYTDSVTAPADRTFLNTTTSGIFAVTQELPSEPQLTLPLQPMPPHAAPAAAAFKPSIAQAPAIAVPAPGARPKPQSDSSVEARH